MDETSTITYEEPVQTVYSADPRLIFYLSIIPRFCLEIFGIISNVINMVILNNENMKSPFSTLLIGLTWADFLFTITMMPMDIWGLMNPQTPYSNFSFTLEFYISFLGYTVSNALFAASSMMTCAIMIYRFIAVKFPLKSNIYITYKKVKLTIIIVFFVGFCSTAKNFAQFAVVKKTVGNLTIKDVILSKYATPQFLKITDNIQVILLLYIPWAIAAIFALLTVITVKKSRTEILQKSDHNDQNSAKEARLTRMLLAVVLVYLISCFFNGLRYNLRGTMGRKRYYTHGVALTVFDCITRSSSLVNGSVNLILYSATNPVFRETFVSIFFEKCRRLSLINHRKSMDTVCTESTSVNSLSTKIDN